MKLGDRIEQALTSVGLTSERVSKWLGKPCRCRERRMRLNALDAWARRVLAGKMDGATEYLRGIMEG